MAGQLGQHYLLEGSECIYLNCELLLIVVLYVHYIYITMDLSPAILFLQQAKFEAFNIVKHCDCVLLH